jgi:hypothetical protein
MSAPTENPIHLEEHKKSPNEDFRLDHQQPDGTPCLYCKIWVENFTKNLPEPLWEPNAQTGKMPWE